MNDELTLAHLKQLEKLAALESRGETVGGWKLGQTSGESRDAFGPGIRAFAWLRRSRIFPSGTRLDWSAVGNGGIENEVCFVLAEDITEPVSAGTVRDALAGFAPAFEINQRRISKDAPVSERIADGLANFGIVVGELRPVPRDWQQQAMLVTLSHDGRPVMRTAAAGHIDDHFESLALLANQLLPFHRHLRAGDHVITGAFGRQAMPEAGIWRGDFGPALATVELEIHGGSG